MPPDASDVEVPEFVPDAAEFTYVSALGMTVCVTDGAALATVAGTSVEAGLALPAASRATTR